MKWNTLHRERRIPYGFICGIQKSKTNKQIKQKQTERKGNPIGCFQRGSGLGMGVKVKGNVVNNIVTDDY